MKYIECPSCHKRFGATPKMCNDEGRFVRCKVCLEKFKIVIYSIDVSQDDEKFETGWDPTLTAPPHQAAELQPADTSMDSGERAEEPSHTTPEASMREELKQGMLPDEGTRAQAEDNLTSSPQSKRVIASIVFAVAAALFALTLYMAVSGNEEQDLATQHVAPVARFTAEEVDKQSLACRTAAARQWLLDYKAMHEDYDAQAFVSMLKQTEDSAEAVQAACKNPSLLQSIIDAATQGKRPDWFAAEIQAIQESDTQ